jgi:hypothetical protein
MVSVVKRGMPVPIKITFDSNVWECIVDPAKLLQHQDASALQKIRGAIESGQASSFISDVVVTLESIRKADRAGFFRSVRISSASSEPVVERGGDGSTHISHSVTMNASFEHFPTLHPKLSTPLKSALTLGFKLINVPRIGWMRLDDGLYKPQLSDERQLGELLDRTHFAAEAFERQGCGVAWVTALGEISLRDHPELTQRGIRSPLLAFAHGNDQDAIPDAVAEWADGDALAAHYGHQHDVFCSLDRGSCAGSRSILYNSRREWLRHQFGLQIRCPKEVAAILG